MYKNVIFFTAIGFWGLLLLGCSPYMKGAMQLDRKNYNAAISNFEEALAQNPENWKARQRLGFSYLKTGQLDRAIDEFNMVLGDPEYVLPTTAMSFTATAPRQPGRAPGLKPGDPKSTYYLGLAYLHNGQRLEAIETWRRYRNRSEPLVEEEIRKQLTLVEISESIRLARQALAEEEELKTKPPKPQTVAVFYFKDTSPDRSFQHLRKALAAMITSDLSLVSSLQVLERFRVQFLLAEMQLGQTGIVEETSAPRFGYLLGAENLIVGALEPGSLRVKTSVASTTQKDVVGSIAVGSEIEEFYVLQKEIVYNILNVLGVSFTADEEARFGKYHTKSLKAVLYFGQGLDALDAGSWKDAKNFFKQAAKEDPGFELAVLYGEASPGASSPTITTLSTITDNDLALAIQNDMSSAITAQAVAKADEATSFNDPVVTNLAQPEPQQTGSVSVSW
jgi:tetratricopeptide (TPR) repeat protein